MAKAFLVYIAEAEGGFIASDASGGAPGYHNFEAAVGMTQKSMLKNLDGSLKRATPPESRLLLAKEEAKPWPGEKGTDSEPEQEPESQIPTGD